MMKKFSLALVTLLTATLSAQHTLTDWQYSLGGIGEDKANALVSYQDGSYYVGGFFSDTVDFDAGPAEAIYSSAGGYEGFILKIDYNGAFSWVIPLEGELPSEVADLMVDDQGYIYATGYFSGPTDFDPSVNSVSLSSISETSDVFVAKYSPEGQLIWVKSFGGVEFDYANAIDVDDAGNVAITGYYTHEVDFDPGDEEFVLTSSNESNDAFIVKLNTDGEFLWAGSIGGDIADVGRGLAFDNDDNIVVVSYFSQEVDADPGPGTFSIISEGQNDILITKISSAGELIWAKGLGGEVMDQADDVEIDGNGNIFLTGYFGGAVDFDPGPGEEILETNATMADIFVLKLDGAGNFLWAKQFGNESGFDYGKSLSMHSFSSVSLTGFFGQSIQFTAENFEWTLETSGQPGAFLLLLNEDGNVMRAGQFTGEMPAEGSSAVVGEGDFLTMMVGNYEGQAVYDGMYPGFEYDSLISNGSSDIFLMSIDIPLNTVDEDWNELKVFPNPSKDRFTVELPQEMSDVIVIIQDMLGRELKRYTSSSCQSIQLELPENQAQYLLEIWSEGNYLGSTRVVKN